MLNRFLVKFQNKILLILWWNVEMLIEIYLICLCFIVHIKSLNSILKAFNTNIPYFIIEPLIFGENWNF